MYDSCIIGLKSIKTNLQLLIKKASGVYLNLVW